MPRQTFRHDFTVIAQYQPQEDLTTHFQYYSQPSSSVSSSSPPASVSPSPTYQQTVIEPQASKKKHICPTCDRTFSTSGHLARHVRVHTGERNHKCPFPGCETRCSRQDNLLQHYRIHLSPGSRRPSSNNVTRAAIAKAMDGMRGKPSRSPISPTASPPPALEEAHLPPPPDSPPPLVSAFPSSDPLMISSPTYSMYRGGHESSPTHGDTMVDPSSEYAGLSGGYYNSQGHVIHGTYNNTLMTPQHGYMNHFGDHVAPAQSPVTDPHFSHAHHSSAPTSLSFSTAAMSSYSHHSPMSRSHDYYMGNFAPPHGDWKMDNIRDKGALGYP